MQFPGAGPQPPIAVYDSSFDRIEDFLTMAVLSGLDGKGDLRFNAVSVSRPDFATAQFVEVVKRFYSGTPFGTGFAAAFPVGLAAGKDKPLPVVAGLLTKKAEDGSQPYKGPIARYSDTGDPATVMRNSISAANPKAALVVTSGPLTSIAQMLALRGVKEMLALNVRHLAIAGSDHIAADPKAAQFVFAEWPTPIFFCGEDVGKAALYPGASIEKDFAWSKVHPVADAYRAFGAMPYDAPTTPLDAALFAGRPGNGFLKPSDPGTLRLGANGVELTPGAGKHHRLQLEPGKSADLVTILTELASAKPVVRARRGPRAADANADANTPAAVKKR